METLQQQEQPADAAVPPGPGGTADAPPLPPAPDDDFARPKLELDAAEGLVRLSGSSTSTGGGGASAASGSSSPRSVNDGQHAPAAPAQEPALPRGPGTGGDGDEEEYEQEVAGSQRRTKRYRPIAEIYRATARFARFSI
ncbi:unnamed protein product [Urochloa decumbens]|uniref:Uncharacterized protein n=1 Tax=Urochloa decumbens TaxID=240449 RepID=A0ABC9FD14_9POAL